MSERPSGAESRLHEALDRYVEQRFAREDGVLRELRAQMVARGFPLIHVSPLAGRALQVLVRASHSRRVLEVGTLGGYSTIWMARGLPPDGRIESVELQPAHAELARDFIARAGLSDRVEVREGDARALLPTLGPDGVYDLVFLDADKESYPAYGIEALRLLRPGGLLVADNAFWKGAVLTPPKDQASRAIHTFNDMLARTETLTTTILPVGDGLAVAVKDG